MSIFFHHCLSKKLQRSLLKVSRRKNPLGLKKGMEKINPKGEFFKKVSSCAEGDKAVEAATHSQILR